MHYVYKVINLIDGNIYIGKHTWKGDGLDPRYFCSSGNPHFHNAVKKYGRNNFIVGLFEIVEDKSMLAQRETYWIQQYYDEGKTCYNLNPYGTGGWPMTYERHVELGKQNVKKANETNKKNGTGFCYDKKIQSDAGKKGAETNRQNGTAIFGMTHEEHVESGKKGGDICVAEGKGIFAADLDTRKEWAQKARDGLTFDQLSEAGKKGAQTQMTEGIGIFGWSIEETTENCIKACDAARQKGVGLFDKRQYNFYDEVTGVLIYTGLYRVARKMMKQRGQSWRQGEQVV